jgi:hypothetical protein
MLALTLVRELSRLEDEFERERLEVWLVLMLALVIVRELSMLEEEFERERLEV